MDLDYDDIVHGVIKIPGDVQLVILSDQFQRLKSVRQLGMLAIILPFANHTRFDHCIGTYHLCKKMLDILESNTAWMGRGNIPHTYRTALELAGLLHDVGHGPFSHVWERIGKNFHHESNAIPCVDAIFASISDDFFPELREDTNYGIELIKALILGDPGRLPSPLPQEYRFLFEIVNNKQCNLDVDKWDYLKRDHHYLHQMCDPKMEFDDVFLNARISDDGAHIEYRYKDYDKIYLLFEARWSFHINCYRLPKNLACDAIIKEIIMRCGGSINGKKLTEIDASDMPSFLDLTDEQVIRFGRNDKQFKYLHDATHIKQVDKNCPQTEDLLVIEDFIRGPGEEMPPDEQFHFYGDESEKEPIYRNNIATKYAVYFQLK